MRWHKFTKENVERHLGSVVVICRMWIDFDGSPTEELDCAKITRAADGSHFVIDGAATACEIVTFTGEEGHDIKLFLPLPACPPVSGLTR